jgi:hypothetical protein
MVYSSQKKNKETIILDANLYRNVPMVFANNKHYYSFVAGTKLGSFVSVICALCLHHLHTLTSGRALDPRTVGVGAGKLQDLE